MNFTTPFKKQISKSTLSIIVGAVIVVFIGVGGYAAGFRQGKTHPQTIIVKGVSNIDDPNVTANFSLFWEAWDALKQYHLKRASVKDEDLLYGAVKGLTGAYDDPNTVFFPPEDSVKFTEDIQGHFGGIGAEIGIRKGELVIISPLKGSPAARADLRSGDRILKVDDFDTEGVDVDKAVKHIRGPIGTKVVLTIDRDGWAAPKEITIIRETIVVPTVDHELRPDGISHVKLYNFNDNAPFAFYEAGIEAITGSAKGMILDLRNDPGGFLEVAVNIAGWFLDRGDVVTIERFATGEENVFRANGNEALTHMPVVILVNGGSASASEILAGALKDHRGVTIIGEKTFGKGSVQELHELSKGSIKITVAEWLRPSRKSIEKVGIQPDVEVKLTEKDIEAGKDPQLEKAVQVLMQEIRDKK